MTAALHRSMARLEAERPLRSLTQLLNSSSGLHFLESKGVYASPQEFKQRLQPPAKADLSEKFGLDSSPLVYDAQQLYVDYRWSVLSKLSLLHDLEHQQGVFTLFIWIDTDRSGSEKAITKFILPVAGKLHTISVASKRTRNIETRFVDLDPRRLRMAIERLEAYLHHFPEKKRIVRPRYERLRALFTRDGAIGLSEFNRQITYFLLQSHMGLDPRPLILSEILNNGLLDKAIDEFINVLPIVVQVFNETIETLVRQDVNPQVNPLNERYFPLYYSCDGDDTRVHLWHEVDGTDHFAVGTCRCGTEYHFFLGSRALSAREITSTTRWSVDVCLPVFLNDFVSGAVAGKSSALYGLVLNAVLEKALGKQPVPMVVPASLAKQRDLGAVDSLLYDYLTAYDYPEL